MYAPNIDNPIFFMKIREYMEESTEMYTLLCGDLNLVLDPKMDSQNYYVHPTGGWTYYFCFFRRQTWFPDILGNSSYPIFTKFGMEVYWVNSLYGIAFGDDSSIAN